MANSRSSRPSLALRSSCRSNSSRICEGNVDRNTTAQAEQSKEATIPPHTDYSITLSKGELAPVRNLFFLSLSEARISIVIADALVKSILPELHLVKLCCCPQKLSYVFRQMLIRAFLLALNG